MIKITTDSTCDLPAQLLEQHHISVIPLGIVKGGELFRDGENITTADIAAHRGLFLDFFLCILYNFGGRFCARLLD